MKLSEFCAYLDSAVPLSFQEGYDNSGIQVGQPDQEITAALLAIDVTEEVIGEAARYGCNLVVSHHPLIFSGLKRIAGRTATERIAMKAIRQNIAVYSAHTNLDSTDFGVSRKMAEKIGLQNVNVLVPLKQKLLKLVTFVPASHLDRVREAVFGAGAGVIGNYDQCGYTLHGEGSFRAGENTNPFAGSRGAIHFEQEVRFETILFAHLRNSVVKALIAAHPYEEVAYDLYQLENINIAAGLGCTGEFEQPLQEMEFIRHVASVFGAEGVRYSNPTGRPVRRIALCGGAGAALLPDALASGADAFVTADIKYHNFFDADDRILMLDIGHFESEKFTTEILYDLIIKKFPKFAVRFSETNTNPINYL